MFRIALFQVALNGKILLEKEFESEDFEKNQNITGLWLGAEDDIPIENKVIGAISEAYLWKKYLTCDDLLKMVRKSHFIHNHSLVIWKCFCL